jgi:hypothetical protein
VTIECASDKTTPYAMTDEVYNSLINLCADICKRNGKKKLIWISDKEKALAYTPEDGEMLLTVHRWFANKACPGDWLMARMSDLANKVNAKLGNSEEEEEVTQETFNSMFNALRKTLQDNDCSNYSAEARSWATSNGLVNGNGTTADGQPNCMWQDFMTREQFITVLYRYAKLLGKA